MAKRSNKSSPLKSPKSDEAANAFAKAMGVELPADPAGLKGSTAKDLQKAERLVKAFRNGAITKEQYLAEIKKIDPMGMFKSVTGNVLEEVGSSSVFAGVSAANVPDSKLQAVIQAAKEGDDEAIRLIKDLKNQGRVSIVKGPGGNMEMVVGKLPMNTNVVPLEAAVSGPAPATVATPTKSSWEGVAFSKLGPEQYREILNDAATGNPKAIALRDALAESGRVQQMPSGDGGRMQWEITPEQVAPEAPSAPVGKQMTAAEREAQETAAQQAAPELRAAAKPAAKTIGPDRAKTLQQFAMDHDVPLDEIHRAYGVNQLSDIPDQNGIEQAVKKLIQERQTKRAASGAGAPAVAQGAAPTGQAVEAVTPAQSGGRIVRVPGGVERGTEQEVRLGVLRKRNIGQMFGNRRDQDALIKNTFGFNASSMKKANPEAYKKLGEIAEALEAIKAGGDIGPSHPRMQAMQDQVKVIKDSFRGGLVNTGAKGWDANINSAHRAILTKAGKIKDELFNYTMDEVGLGRGNRGGRTPRTVANPNARTANTIPELGGGTSAAEGEVPEIRTGGGPRGTTLGGATVGAAAATATPAAAPVAASSGRVELTAEEKKIWGQAVKADKAKYGTSSRTATEAQQRAKEALARAIVAQRGGGAPAKPAAGFVPPKASAAPAAPGAIPEATPDAAISGGAPTPAAPEAPAPAVGPKISNKEVYGLRQQLGRVSPKAEAGLLRAAKAKGLNIASLEEIPASEMPWVQKWISGTTNYGLPAYAKKAPKTGRMQGPWPTGPEMGPATAATEAAAKAMSSVEPNWERGVAGPMMDASKYPAGGAGGGFMAGAKKVGGKALAWLGPLFAIYGVYETMKMLQEGSIGQADQERLQTMQALGQLSGGMQQDMDQRQMVQGMQRMVDLAAIQRQQSLDQMQNQYTGDAAMDALLRGQQASLAALAQPSRPSIAEMMARM